MSTTSQQAKDNFDVAIYSLYMWLVPHISVQIGEFVRATRASQHWQTEERQEEAMKTIWRHSLIAIASGLSVMAVTAVAVAVPTRGLEPNMIKIVEGGSNLMAALVLLGLSMKVPKWVGMYYSQKYAKFQSVGRTSWELGFHVRWAIHRQFWMIYFTLLPWYCGISGVRITVSIVTGFVSGLALDSFVYPSRRHPRFQTTWFRFLILLVIASFSSLAFSVGVVFCHYVWRKDEVWSATETGEPFVYTVSFFVWLTFICLIHLVLWRSTVRKVRAGSEHPGLEHSAKNSDLTNDRMLMSLYMSEQKKRELKKKESTENMEVIREGNVEEDEENGGDEPTQEDKKDNFEETEPEYNEEDGAKRIAGGPTLEMPTSVGTVAMNLRDESEDYVVPTYWQLVKSKICSPFFSDPRLNLFDKAISFLKWIGISVFAIIFLVFVVVNIGAQKQIRSTQAKIGDVTRLLYTDMDLKEVCAFDNRGANSTIQTFVNKDAAHAAGFLVLHCGACGECSTWHNLEKEWSTRNYLASESQRCATKALFGGGPEAVDNCLEQEPISFRDGCVRCWTTDILCTKKYCAFIFLQANIINRVTNFAVGPNVVTSATCEEAHCEVGQFVPCSGATRRRMNIKSTIERPPEQQCNIVDVDWEELFGPCCTLDDFKCPGGERCQQE